VLEAKAGDLSEARRDPIQAFARLHQQFRSDTGIQHAYAQAKRLIDKVRASREPVALYGKDKQIAVEIDPAKVTRFYPIIVTLDNFGMLATDLALLLDKCPDDPYPWVVNINDLELFVDVFVEKRAWDPFKFLQWLEERRDRMSDFQTSDELEIAGVFIKHGSLNGIPKDAAILNLRTYADIFEDYSHEKLGDVPAVIEEDDGPPMFEEFPREVAQQHERRFRDQEKRIIGRNERCPCNSGKKYKKCHGKE
jgi:hypothetical protein